MDDIERARLEAAGFKVGTVQEFLGLTDTQSALIEARLRLAAAIKASRLAAGLTQAAAARLGVSQPYIVRLETGSPKTTIDAMIQALLDWGASLETVGAVLAAPTPVVATETAISSRSSRRRVPSAGRRKPVSGVKAGPGQTADRA